jgi:hypothetical protein
MKNAYWNRIVLRNKTSHHRNYGLANLATAQVKTLFGEVEYIEVRLKALFVLEV